MLIYLQMIDQPEDKSKFEKLYKRYRDMMYRVAFDILGNPQDAEDAVHQAFIKILENIHKISDLKCPKTRSYIVTIVERKAIDQYRKKKRHPLVPYDDETVGLRVEYAGPNRLAGCMAQLPPVYRQVLLLKYSHGMTLQEIAQTLDTTPDNAGKILQRAKVKLFDLCREEELI